MTGARVLVGHNIAMMATLPAGSVHAVVTSPPYWGLRDYGLPPTRWADGAECCLGLETTPEAFVAHLVEVFDNVARVLRPDGTCWVNLGDCYAGGGRAGKNPEYQARHTEFGKEGRGAAAYGVPIGVPKGCKPKDLVGIPWRFAFAMQARGWYLRAAIPWVKRSVMPSSVRDRPTTGTETVFLFAHPESGGRYFYDIEATKAGAAKGAAGSRFDQGKTGATQRRVQAGPRESDEAPTRQRRDTDFFFDSLRAILDGGKALLHPEPEDEDTEAGTISDGHPSPLAVVVNPSPFKEAHFATFPEALIAPMILASTSEKGACGACGSPWVREVERAERPGVGLTVKPNKADGGLTAEHGLDRMGMSHFKADQWNKANPPKTVGWKSSCPCPAADPVPATVLDPFGGSGTTAAAAIRLGRNAIICEMNPEYAAIAERRIAIAEEDSRPAPILQQSLFA